MDLIIVSLESQSYEQLTNLHRLVKNNIKEVEKELGPSKSKKASDLNESELLLLKKRTVLIKLRMQIKNLLLGFSEKVKLPEVI